MWINIEYLTRDAFSKASITLSTLTGKVTACVQRLLHLARSKRHAVLDIYIYRERKYISYDPLHRICMESLVRAKQPSRRRRGRMHCTFACSCVRCYYSLNLLLFRPSTCTMKQTSPSLLFFGLQLAKIKQELPHMQMQIYL